MIHRQGINALFTLLAVLGLALLPASAAYADDASDKTKALGNAPKDVAEKIAATDADKTPEGWSHKLWLGGTFSYSQSSNVVGAIDGTSLQLGLLLDGALTLRRGQSTLENLLKIQHTRSKTPVLDAFIKSLDDFELQSTFLYHLSQPAWLGPYARVRLVTALFEGYEVRADPITVVFQYLDGTQQSQDFAAGEHIHLTDAFEPTLISENAGLFANPIDRKDFSLKAKLGFGLQHVLIGSGFVVKDDAATPELEVQQLEDATQGGGILEVNLAGQLAEGVNWKASTNVFAQVFSSSDASVSALNVEVAAGLSVKLAKWASLDYVLLARKIPILLDQWQVQNGLVLTTGFNLL